MRLPERAAGAEQTFDIVYDLVAEPDQPPPTEFVPVTRQKARISADMRAKRVSLMNNPG
jgi:hypothetical protein